MKKIWVSGCAITLLALSGCASHNVISRNAETAPGVNVTSTDDGVVIDSISQRRALTKLSADEVKSCLASSISSSNSEQSAAAESPKSDAASSNTPGVSHSNDASTQFITGWTQAGNKTLAYRLELETLGNSNYYLYDQLGLSNSRSDDANSYSTVPAWDGDVAANVYGALSKVTDNIQHCLQGDTQTTAQSN